MVSPHLALVLAALAPSQEPTLLPETPDDWRFERLELPLSFAPEIELEGFEELAFAPGMFEPGSATYFTYVLAIHVEGEERIDGAFLESFLELYYRGLCRAVGGSRELELDLEQITVRVEPGAHGYVATIDLFDAFTTGEKLRLSLEISVHPGEGGSGADIFALASPLDRGAPAWTTLDAIGSRWRASRPSMSFLNHLFMMPDEETYAALVDSPFLESFGVREERTTVRKDMSYTGLYFYGRHTYFEFLKPGGPAAFPAGSTGLAFGFERPGDTARMGQRLETRGIPTFAGPRTRELDGEPLPWFKIMGVQQASEPSRLNTFSLEYDPGFLERWHGDLAAVALGTERAVERAPILQRYAASLDQLDMREQGLFGDVIEVHLALDEAEREHLLEICRAFSYVIDPPGDGDGMRVVHGPGFRVRISPSTAPGGVTGFVTSLRRSVEARTVALGRLEIRLEGRRASFRLAAEPSVTPRAK